MHGPHLFDGRINYLHLQGRPVVFFVLCLCFPGLPVALPYYLHLSKCLSVRVHYKQEARPQQERKKERKITAGVSKTGKIKSMKPLERT